MGKIPQREGKVPDRKIPAASDKEITSRERIKRIIGILRLDGREIEIHLHQYIEISKISNTTQNTFTLKLSNILLNLAEENVDYVYINFIFSGVELFGKCRFVEQSRAFITLQFPGVLKSRTKRRHPRVKLAKKLQAAIKYKEFPEKTVEKIASRDLPVKYSQLFWEAQRENVDIKKVFLMGLKEIKKISPFSEIVIYSKNNIKMREARIMRKSGRVLYIDDCSNTQSYTRLIASDNIINYLDYLNELKINGCFQEELTAELQEIIQEDLAKGCTSKVLIPIFSQDGIVGHILVYKKDINDKITAEDVTDLMALSSLLSIGIENAHFTTDIEDFVGSDLIDISEGGLLLRIQNDEKKVNIPEGEVIEVKFIDKDKEITLKGNICRKDQESLSYAIKFADMSSENKKILKNFIDGKIEKNKDN